MVVGHWTSNDILLSYIYSFHMPALFIVSGYLYKPHSWVKTIVGFSIPIVFFSLVNLAVNLLLGDVPANCLSFQYVLTRTIDWRYGLRGGLFPGIWFIYALVGIRLLLGDISRKKVSYKYYIPLAIIIAMYMALEGHPADINTLFRGYYIGTVVPALPFFCLGMFLKDKSWHPRQLDTYKFILPLVMFFLLIPTTKNYCDIYNSRYGYSYLVAAIIACGFSLLLFVLTYRLPSLRFVETISKGTMVVLGTHMSILRILNHLLPNVIPLSFLVITIIVCYYIILLCERYCPVLLGKWRYISFSDKPTSSVI